MLPPHVTFSDLLILFPDPWPKARHHKHRILQPAFLSAAAERGSSDCRLSFRTDFVPYFEAGKKIIQAHPQWNISDETWPFESSTVFQSRAPAYQSLVARRSSSSRVP
jgi:tRNA (guanine-N7-)-methyltransferase